MHLELQRQSLDHKNTPRQQSRANDNITHFHFIEVFGRGNQNQNEAEKIHHC